MTRSAASQWTGPSLDADLHSYEEIHLGAGLWNRGNVLGGAFWLGRDCDGKLLDDLDLGRSKVAHGELPRR